MVNVTVRFMTYSINTGEKMNIDQLIIEVTRRCNLSCEHCLRGRAQSKDIDPEMILKFLKINNIRYISSLTFSGGEPCMNPSAIKIITDYLVKENIGLESFYMATNGMVMSYPLLKSLAKLRVLVEEDEMFTIAISKDQFHANEGEIHPIWKLIRTEDKEVKYKYLIAEGRGKNLNPNGRVPVDGKWEWDDDNITEGMIYINALGKICKECDYSYSTQAVMNMGLCLEGKLIDREDNNYEED